jgi:dynactin 1
MADLEAELTKGRKQEQAYEEAIGALQADLDAAERELATLKSGPTPGERARRT